MSTGERLIFAARTAEETHVDVEARAGVWVVHATVRGAGYTVTHGPSGSLLRVFARLEDAEGCALTLDYAYPQGLRGDRYQNLEPTPAELEAIRSIAQREFERAAERARDRALVEALGNRQVFFG